MITTLSSVIWVLDALSSKDLALLFIYWKSCSNVNTTNPIGKWSKIYVSLFLGVYVLLVIILWNSLILGVTNSKSNYFVNDSLFFS